MNPLRAAVTDPVGTRPSVALQLSTGKPIRILYAAVAVLSVLSLAGHVARLAGLEVQGLVTYINFVNVDGERNLPTWFSTMILLAGALLAWTTSRSPGEQSGRWQRHWRLLAVVFVLLSIDELTMIHERLSAPVRELLDLSGPLYFGWYVVALPLLVLFVGYYARFLAALPADIRSGLLFSGALYVAGAIGMEMVGAALFDSAQTWDTWGYQVAAAVEELLEMVGAVAFLGTLATYAQTVDVRR